MIRAVIFDFGETLATGKLDAKSYRQQLLAYIHSLGYALSEKTLAKTLDGMLATLMKARKENRELTFEELYSRVLVKLGINPTEEVLSHIHGLYAENFTVEPVPRVTEVLQTLYGRYKLAVISNAMSQLPRLALEKAGLTKFFQLIIISRDLGIRKPDPKIFKYALKKLGVKPEETIHVGDSMEQDVVGAKNAGIKSVWIKNKEEPILEEPNYTISSITELPKIINRYA